jgi:hypothetical protein
LRFPQRVEISPFKHSSRSFPLNDSQYPFSQGLPGSMYNGRVPRMKPEFLQCPAHFGLDG